MRLRVVAVGLVALLAGLTLAPSAVAHAYLRSSVPGPQGVVSALPSALSLTFDEVVVARYARVEVLAPGGGNLAGPPRVAGSLVVVALRPGTGRGSYTVRWRMVAQDDGHQTAGAFSFGVRSRPAAPAPQHGAGVPVAPQLLAWLQFVSIVLSGGLLVARALLWAPPRGGPVDDAGGPDVAVVLGCAIAGAVLGIHAALLAFLTGAYPIVGQGLSGFVNAQIEPLRVETHLGQAWTGMTFAWFAVLALAVAAWTSPRWRERLLAGAGALTLAIAFGLSWASHPASRGTLALVADYLHLIAAALWVGGLLGLAVLAAVARDGSRARLARECVVRFARVAVPSVAVIALAGVLLALRELPDASTLLSTGYGRALVIKSGVALAALALGGYHRRLVVPRLIAGAPIAEMRRTLLVELGLLVGVLALAAVLSQAAPPGS